MYRIGVNLNPRLENEGDPAPKFGVLFLSPAIALSTENVSMKPLPILLLLTVALSTSAVADPSPRITPTVRLIQQAEPAVVAVFSEQGQGKLSSGSGAIIHEEGYILTADHVVRDQPGWVLLEDRPPVRYRMIGRSPEKDLAVIKIDAAQPLARIPLGRSHDLMTGEPILAAGNPGGRGIVFSSGIVSSRQVLLGMNALVMSQFASDTRDRFILFDAASNPGNSGGPLLNAEGRQIGVVCGKYKEEENENFAIPADRVRRHIPSIVAAQQRGGFSTGIETDPFAGAATVIAVAADSAAARAGVQPGDVLVQFDGRPVRDAVDWHLLLVGRKPKQSVELIYRQAEETKTINLTLDDYPLAPSVAEEGKSPGLHYALYTGRYTAMPDFATLTPQDEGATDVFHASKVAGDLKDGYALVFTGYVKIPQTGVYTLGVSSDDGSRLYLHDELLLDNDGPHPAQEITHVVRLSEGLHPIRVEYTEISGDEQLEVSIEGEGLNRQTIPAGMLFRDGETGEG